MDHSTTRRRLLGGILLAPLAARASLSQAASSDKATVSSDSPSLQTAKEVRPAINHRALDRLGWKLSSQAYTFRELTLFETIDVLHALGIRYIEMFPGQSFSKENPEPFSHTSSPQLMDELKKKLRSARVTPVCYGVTGTGRDEESARRVFDFAKSFKLLAIATEPSEEDLPMLDGLAKEYKIGIALHNHPRPSRYWDPDHVLETTKGLSKWSGACADTGHWYRSGLSPLESLKKLEGRITSLHFKDLSPDRRDVPWGTGVCDAKALLAELKRQGYKGAFSIEYEVTSGPELVRNVAKCCDFFSKTAVSLA